MVHYVIVDGLVDKHKEQVFPKDEITESMISYRVQGSAHMACTPGPSGSMELLEAVHHTYPRLRAL